MDENSEKRRILKESLTIVNELGKLEIDDIINKNDNIIIQLTKLIDQSKKLRKNFYWDLK